MSNTKYTDGNIITGNRKFTVNKAPIGGGTAVDYVYHATTFKYTKDGKTLYVQDGDDLPLGSVTTAGFTTGDATITGLSNQPLLEQHDILEFTDRNLVVHEFRIEKVGESFSDGQATVQDITLVENLN